MKVRNTDPGLGTAGREWKPERRGVPYAGAQLWFLLALVATLLLILAGCGGQATPETGERVVTEQVVITQEVERVVTEQVEVVVTEQVEVEVEVVITPTPAPRGEPRYGGTVTEAWYLTLPNFNPWHNSQEQLQLYKRMFSRLVVVRPDLTIGPDLAESWESSDDAMTFTFHLAENATWHDGEPVTAEDVKFTFERAALPETGSGWAPNAAQLEGAEAFLAGEADEITGIRVLDEHTVEFALVEPNVAILSSFNDWAIAPRHIFEDIEPEDVDTSDPVVRNPIGSGPWKLVNYVPDQIIELERHDGYFKEGLPYIDRYVYRIFQNQPATIAALEAGEVDIAQLDPADHAHVATLPHLAIDGYFKRAPQVLAYNRNLEPWDTPQVRKAIAHAIDLEGLCISSFEGDCKMPVHTFPQQWTWSPTAAMYPYNPDLARSMLEEAGFDFSRSYRMLTFYTTSDPVAIVAMLSDIGINVELQVLDVPAYLEERETDSWDLSYFGSFGSADPNDIASYVSTCGSEQTHYLRYCNPEVEELMAQGRTIVDPDERAAVYQQIDEIIQEELPWFAILNGQIFVGYNRRVVNFEYNRYWYDAAETWYVFE